MNTLEKRIEKLEQKAQRMEREFYGWPMNPWTPEQAVEAVRRHPDQTVFWRSAHELKVDTAGKIRYPDEDMTGVCAQDWRARWALVHVGQWQDFVAVGVRRMRMGRSWLTFMVVVRRDNALIAAAAAAGA